MKVLSIIERKGPTLFRLLRAAAFAPSKHPEPTVDETFPDSEPTFAFHFSKPPLSGKGLNRPDPFLVNSAILV